MNNKTKYSEELLHTNLMELLGGKNVSIEKIDAIPPTPPVELNRNGGNDGNRLPELRSGEVDDILSKPPSWLIRWGITVFFFVLIILLGVSWFVEYPDLVSANLKVVSNNLPKSVNAKTEGRLIKLLVKDGQMVKNGDILAYLESTANHEEIFALEKTVDNLVELAAQNNFSRIHQTKIPLFFSLGELQKSYQTFQEAFVRSQASMSDGSYNKKKSAVGRDINSLQNLQNNTYQQLTLQEKDLQLAQEEAQTQQRLSEKGFVSKLDARNAMSKYLSKKQAYQQAKSSLDNNRMSQNQKQQEIIEIDRTITEQKNSLVQSINTLKSEIVAWKQRYVTMASTTGKVNFLTHLQENQSVRMGQELLYILPDGAGYYGEMMLGQYNFGKVQKGQEVIIKFQSYPFQEFGTVTGKVDYISDIPKDSAFLVKVSFPKGLLTSANKNLPFRNGMSASGEIITENLRLIEKFFYDFRKSMKR